MRRSTLLTQVLAVNALLVGVTALIAAVVARDRLPDATSGDGLLVLGLTVASAILLNSLLLRARLEPMNRLVRAMAAVDLARPGKRADAPRRAARELHVLTDAFNRMLTRLEDQRRESGRAVLRAQEQERSRIAQDLHDEVNQALTAILLRLSATTSMSGWRSISNFKPPRTMPWSSAIRILMSLPWSARWWCRRPARCRRRGCRRPAARARACRSAPGRRDGRARAR